MTLNVFAEVGLGPGAPASLCRKFVAGDLSRGGGLGLGLTRNVRLLLLLSPAAAACSLTQVLVESSLPPSSVRQLLPQILSSWGNKSLRSLRNLPLSRSLAAQVGKRTTPPILAIAQRFSGLRTGPALGLGIPSGQTTLMFFLRALAHLASCHGVLLAILEPDLDILPLRAQVSRAAVQGDAPE